jgi:hypothetical protein
MIGPNIQGQVTPMTVTRIQNPDGSYTYNLSFSATNRTQVVSGRASFNANDRSFPPS